MTDAAPTGSEMTGETPPVVSGARPVPSEQEVAAIVAALEVAWPRAVGVQPEPDVSRWRFSGRWWAKPLPVRRDRP
ncbi:MAG: hypothetical protein WHS89_14655 [Acidimicrobiales bacterium]|jgi:hypothetical protein